MGNSKEGWGDNWELLSPLLQTDPRQSDKVSNDNQEVKSGWLGQNIAAHREDFEDGGTVQRTAQ